MAVNIAKTVTYIGTAPIYDNWANTGLTFEPGQTYSVQEAQYDLLLAQQWLFIDGSKPGDLDGTVDLYIDEDTGLVHTNLQGVTETYDIGTTPRYPSRIGLVGFRRDSTAVFPGRVAFIGDSRPFRGYFRGVKAVSTSLAAAWYGTPQGVGPGVTADGTGTLEYRASDRSIRWTAASDTTGPWQSYVNGWQYVQSGSADKWIAIVKLNAAYSDADLSASLAYSGSMYQGWEHHGFVFHLLSALKFPWSWSDMKFLGAGGQTLADAATITDYYAEAAPGPGLDVIRIGTNSITDGATAAEMIADAWTLIKSRWAQGRKIYWIGESARYSSGTTAISAAQLAALLGFNTWLDQLAQQNPDKFAYFDHYSRTVDPTLLTGVPISTAGVAPLADTVHDSVYGAMKLGDWAASDLVSRGWVAKGRSSSVGDANNFAFSNAAFQATTAATGTGASGLMPTGCAMLRTTGADLTIAGSVEASTDGVSSAWFVMEIAQSSAAAQAGSLTGPNIDFVAAGFAVGDWVTFEFELDIVSAVSIDKVEAFLLCNGASPTTRISMEKTGTTSSVGIAATSSPWLLRSFPMQIPTACTTLDFWITFTTAASASAAGKFRIRNLVVQNYPV